jgi:hypothetical protein
VKNRQGYLRVPLLSISLTFPWAPRLGFRSLGFLRRILEDQFEIHYLTLKVRKVSLFEDRKRGRALGTKRESLDNRNQKGNTE